MANTERFNQCILEIIESERDYVMKLQTVVDVFITPLKQYNMINSIIINANEIQIQFNCWEVLCNIHSEFYDNLLQHQQNHLQQPQDDDNDTFHHQIGYLFLEFIDNLKLYKNYLLNFNLYQNHRTAILNNKSSKFNKKYYQFLEAVKLNPECNGYTLEMFLIEPLQRVSQYKNLLEKLLRYIPSTSLDSADTSLLISKKSASIYEYGSNRNNNSSNNTSSYTEDVNDSFCSTSSSKRSNQNNMSHLSLPVTSTSSSSPLHSTITQVLHKIYQIAIDNNNAFSQLENRMQIMYMMQSLEPKTRINLLDDPQRKLLKTGELQLLHSTTGLTVYRFWLFSDKLVYGKPARTTRSSFSPSFSSSLSSKSPVLVNNSTNPFDNTSLTQPVNKRRGSASSVGSINSTTSSNYSTDNNNNNNKYNNNNNALYTLSLPEINLLECRVTKKSDGCAFKVLSVMGELLLSALTHEDKCDWIDAINDAVAELAFEEQQQQSQIQQHQQLQVVPSSSSSRSSFTSSSNMNNNNTIQLSSRKNSFSAEIDRFQQLALALQPQLSSRGGQQLSSNILTNNSSNNSNNTGGGGVVTRVRGRTSGSVMVNVHICEQCLQTYNKKNTKQMCMNCGANICEECSTKRFLLTLISVPSSSTSSFSSSSSATAVPTPSRVCNPCYVNLCLGGSEGNITEPLPTRFLPAPQELLLQKSLQKLNTKSCNSCHIDYSTWRVSTTCINCFTAVCENCCQKKYLISYIDTNIASKICNDCYTLFENGQGGGAFAKHIAGSSNDNPHNQKRSLTHTRSRSSSAANLSQLVPVLPLPLEQQQSSYQQSQHLHTQASQSQKQSKQPLPSRLSQSHHSQSDMIMTSTNIFNNNNNNNNSGNGILSGSGNNSGNSTARSVSSPRGSVNSRESSTTVAGGVTSLSRDSLSQSHSVAQTQSQPTLTAAAQSRLVLRQSTGSVQSQSRQLLRLSNGGTSDISISPRPNYAPPLPPAINSSRSTNSLQNSSHGGGNDNNNSAGIRNSTGSINSKLNDVKTSETRIIRPLSSSSASASSKYSSRRSSRSTSPFNSSSSSSCSITDMTPMTGTNVAVSNVSPRIISPINSDRSDKSNKSNNGVTILQPKSILSKSATTTSTASTSNPTTSTTTVNLTSKNSSILSPRPPIPLQPQLSFTYEPECPEILLELSSNSPQKSTTEKQTLSSSKHYIQSSSSSSSSFPSSSQKVIQKSPSQHVLNKREVYDEESYCGGSSSVGNITNRSLSSKSIHSINGNNGRNDNNNSSSNNKVATQTPANIKITTSTTTSTATTTRAVASPIKPKKPLMTKDIIMAASNNNNNINNSNGYGSGGNMNNSRIRTFSEPPKLKNTNNNSVPTVDNTDTAYYTQYKPRNTLISSLTSIAGISNNNSSGGGSNGVNSARSSNSSSSFSSNHSISPRVGITTSSSSAVSPVPHSRSRSATVSVSSSGSGKNRTSCVIM